MCTWWQWAYWFCSMLEFIDSDKACVQWCRLTYSSSFSSISLLPPYPGELMDVSRGRRRSEGCWITFCLRGFICVAHHQRPPFKPLWPFLGEIMASFSLLFSSYHFSFLQVSQNMHIMMIYAVCIWYTCLTSIHICSICILCIHTHTAILCFDCYPPFLQSLQSL